MIKIQVLGTGCPKCKQLAANAESAVADLGLNVPVEKITDLREIMSFGVMTTPALAINGTVIVSGRVIPAQEIKKHLNDSGASHAE